MLPLDAHKDRVKVARLRPTLGASHPKLVAPVQGRPQAQEAPRVVNSRARSPPGARLLHLPKTAAIGSTPSKRISHPC
jgi:hypothetical protein